MHLGDRDKLLWHTTKGRRDRDQIRHQIERKEDKDEDSPLFLQASDTKHNPYLKSFDGKTCTDILPWRVVFSPIREGWQRRHGWWETIPARFWSKWRRHKKKIRLKILSLLSTASNFTAHPYLELKKETLTASPSSGIIDDYFFFLTKKNPSVLNRTWDRMKSLQLKDRERHELSWEKEDRKRTRKTVVVAVDVAVDTRGKKKNYELLEDLFVPSSWCSLWLESLRLGRQLEFGLRFLLSLFVLDYSLSLSFVYRHTRETCIQCLSQRMALDLKQHDVASSSSSNFLLNSWLKRHLQPLLVVLTSFRSLSPFCSFNEWVDWNEEDISRKTFFIHSFLWMLHRLLE